MKHTTTLQPPIKDLFLKENLTPQQATLLNTLNLIAAEKILSSCGQYFNKFKKTKVGPCKDGECFGIAANKMGDQYQYVEGYIEDRSGNKTYHAWNVDKDGFHVDFAIKNYQKYKYFGVILDKRTVHQISYENGHIWIAVLPFLQTDQFNKLLRNKKLKVISGLS